MRISGQTTRVAPVLLLLGLSVSAPPGTVTIPFESEQKLTAADLADLAKFGSSVSVDGRTIAIGASSDYEAGFQAGAAYVFEREKTGWVRRAKVIASDANGGDHFGSSISMNGRTLVVGAPDKERPLDAGAAYMFRQVRGTWVQEAKLIASDKQAGDGFGTSVSVSGKTVVIGSPHDDALGVNSGAAYIFERRRGDWPQLSKLTAADGSSDHGFGFDVSVSNRTVVVSAPGDDHAGITSGSVYVFRRRGDVWTQVAKLTASDAVRQHLFGWSVSNHKRTIVVGAPLDGAAAFFSGAAYVFRRTGSAWMQQSKLAPSDAVEFQEFGSAVSIDGRTIVVGAPRDVTTGVFSSGSAYVFRRRAGNWMQTIKFAASERFENFGSSVSVDGGTVVIGDPLSGEPGFLPGAAYVFR